MFYVCHCMCILGGSSPCRRIFLLGIAHPVVGPPFRYRGCKRGRDYEEGRHVALMYVKIIVIKLF